MKSLFISYDGMTDPLGESQIIPYLRALAEAGHQIHILSFEKKQRFEDESSRLSRVLGDCAIEWTPLQFTAKPRYLAKIWDLAKMYFFAGKVFLEVSPDIVHCRSYQAAQVALFLKRLRPTKILFDIRGFWIDERVDGGIWDRKNWTGTLLYNIFKTIEPKLYANADHIVTLTEASIPIINQWAKSPPPITVIPCCADFAHFNLPSREQVRTAKTGLGFGEDDLVIGYVGSLGTWYMVKEMMLFYKFALEEVENVKLLFVTRDWNESWENTWNDLGLKQHRSKLIVRASSREEMPGLLSASDVTLCFIKPCFSKAASSPTKIAESLSLGIPVIANDIGDVGSQVRELEAGYVLDSFAPPDLEIAAKALPLLVKRDPLELRERARREFDLERARSLYTQVYSRIVSG